MRAPSWVELAGRNAAAEAASVAGTLVVSESPTQRVRFDFLHAPGQKWRIEQSGDPVYLSSGTTSVVRIENEMHLRDGGIQLAWLGPQFSPLDLLGRDSLLGKLSTELTPDGPAIGVEVAGRSAWSVRLRTSKDEAIDLAFDDATGVLLQVANSDGYVLLRVDDLSESELLPDSLFRWDGPVREAQRDRSGPPRNEVSEAERLEFLRVLIVAQEMPQEVLAAIGTADSDAAARDALVQLLGVTESLAEAIMATPIGQFRPDHLAANRRTLHELEERHRG